MDSFEYFKDFSKKIGEIVRYINLSIIATGYAIITTDNKVFISMISSSKQFILISILLAILGVLIDYLHVLMGYINSRYLYVNNLPIHDPGINIIRIFGMAFFYVKQVVTLFAAGLLIYIIYVNIN